MPTVALLREYLNQVGTGAAVDLVLGRVLDRATAIVEGYLGYSFTAYETDSVTVYGNGTDYLVLPEYRRGTVTLVSTVSPWGVPSYIERAGALVATRAEVLGRYGYPSRLANWLSPWALAGAWLQGVPYTVAADFGTGPMPRDVEEVVLEVAVNIWQSRQAGRFTNVIGVEGGGAVGYEGALTPLQRMVLDAHKRSGPGIY